MEDMEALLEERGEPVELSPNQKRKLENFEQTLKRIKSAENLQYTRNAYKQGMKGFESLTSEQMEEHRQTLALMDRRLSELVSSE